MSADTTFLEDAMALMVEDEDAPAILFVVRPALRRSKLLINLDCPLFLFDAAKALLGAAAKRATTHGDFKLANMADAALENLGQQPAFHEVIVERGPER